MNSFFILAVDFFFTNDIINFKLITYAFMAPMACHMRGASCCTQRPRGPALAAGIFSHANVSESCPGLGQDSDSSTFARIFENTKLNALVWF